LDEDGVTVGDERLGARRHERDTIFIGLDFLRNADAHGLSDSGERGCRRAAAAGGARRTVVATGYMVTEAAGGAPLRSPAATSGKRSPQATCFPPGMWGAPRPTCQAPHPRFGPSVTAVCRPGGKNSRHTAAISSGVMASMSASTSSSVRKGS